jgi:hypothetical protein
MFGLCALTIDYLIIFIRGEQRGYIPSVRDNFLNFIKGIFVMAYYEHLPIYRKAMETAVYFESIVRNFSRYNKYGLGAEMRTKSRDIVKLIIKANSEKSKFPLLYELRLHIEELKILIRISKEAKAFKTTARVQPDDTGLMIK